MASGCPGGTCSPTPLAQGPRSQQGDPPTGGNQGSGPQAPSGCSGQVTSPLSGDLRAGTLVHVLPISTIPNWGGDLV